MSSASVVLKGLSSISVPTKLTSNVVSYDFSVKHEAIIT